MCDAQPMNLRLVDDRRIVIRHENGLFTAKVEPPVEGHDLDATFALWRDARGHAAGVRLVHRIPILDMTCSEGLVG